MEGDGGIGGLRVTKMWPCLETGKDWRTLRSNVLHFAQGKGSAIASFMQPKRKEMDEHGDGVDGGGTRLGLVAR